MANADPDDLNALAGEHVLGTLDADERRSVEARLLSDPELRRAVAAWETRLQPLADMAVPEEPSTGLLDRIMTAIPTDAGSSAQLIVLEGALRRWRIATAALGVLALALIAVTAGDRLLPPSGLTGEYVAVLAADDVQSGFVATIDLTNQRLTIRRVADPAPEARSYELWEIEPGQDPRSLGVIDAAHERFEIRSIPSEGAILAVSLEPPGGSPTGLPTGPVLYTGSLTRVD